LRKFPALMGWLVSGALPGYFIYKRTHWRIVWLERTKYRRK
jgi:hypothetical protein